MWHFSFFMSKIKYDFNVKYGGNFTALYNYKKGDTPVIKSQGTKNGVFALLDIEPNYRYVLTVARTGSVGACFFHKNPVYVTDDCMVLIPKEDLSEIEMLSFAAIISKEAYRYNYSRKVTPKRLKESKITNIKKEFKLPKLPSLMPFNKNPIKLTNRKWEWFKYGGEQGIFDIKKGFYNRKPESSERGKIPFISATEYNNGVSSYHTKDEIRKTSKAGSGKNHDISEKIFAADCITVSNGGSVGNAFYQNNNFTCAHHVNPFYLKDKKVTINPFIGLFLCSLIKLEAYKYTTCGREWRLERMPKSKIKLPVNQDGKPDWQFMENYIKSLPYSSNLEL